MKNLCLIIFCSILLFACPPIPETGAYNKEIWTSPGGDKLPYRIMFPDGFNPKAETQYPVILFLHGAGERGNDNESQLIHIAPKFLEPNFKNKAIIVFPQCPKGGYWANIEKRWSKINSKTAPTPSMANVIELMNELTSNTFVDKTRIYVGGLSMGGFGTFDLMSRKPEMFAAAIAICGGADLDLVENYKDIPIQIFHGAKDPVVPVELSREVHEVLKSMDGNSTYIEYPDGGHLVWDQAFQESDLLPWLFKQQKGN